jgi:hypothetical protein
MTYPPGHLPHSHLMAMDASADHSWEQGVDTPYNDCWDIMSYNTCIYSFNTSTHGKQGPELQVAYKRKMGWVPSSRIFSRSNADPAPSTVTLAPVSEPNLPGFLMADIEIAGVGNYVVEYRVPTGFDRGILDAPPDTAPAATSAVVIRELRSNGETYLVQRQNGETGWAQGEQFTDVGNFLGISVDALTPQSAAITINPRFSNTANAGGLCGNKFVGVVHQCPAGTTCNARVLPPAPGGGPPPITTEYFCL